MICLDSAAFRPAREVVASLDALRARLRDSSGPASPVLAPGDPEASSRSAAAGVLAVARALVDGSPTSPPRHPRRGRSALKITAVDTFLVRPRWVFVRIQTDEGITGWGEPGGEARGPAVIAAVRTWATTCAGRIRC